MLYSIKRGEIFIPNNEDFNIKHILDCGQVFRYKPTPFGYCLYTLGHKVDIFCQKSGTKIICKDEKYIEKYFDLCTDYATIKSVLKQEPNLSKAVEYGKGIRILRQNPLETVISFIISANNNIPRIKGIIEKLCEGYGEKYADYYGFPTLSNLIQIPKEFFVKIGCGYRSEYLYKTIQLLNNGFDLNQLYSLTTDIARQKLMTLMGVGNKVADCILLFAFGKVDVFPTDTWIVQAYEEMYGKTRLNAKQISQFFSKKYGNLSGYAQQYMFYVKRENK